MNVKTFKRANSPRKSRGGRPSPEDSVRLTHHIVEIGTRLFLENGFEATSVDNIANVARISKRTFYQRFASKSDLFTAVVIRFADEKLKNLTLSAVGSSPQEKLESIALQLIKICIDPDTVALDRVVIAEVKRFPELGRIVYDFGVPQATAPIVEVIKQIWHRRDVSESELNYAAEHFLHAIVLGAMRRVVFGLDEPRLMSAQIRRTKFAVRLFLSGLTNKSFALD